VFGLQAMGREIPSLDASARLSVKWPQWYPLTADDRQKDAQTLVSLVSAGLLSRETATLAVADTFSIKDLPQ